MLFAKHMQGSEELTKLSKAPMALQGEVIENDSI
jgi:hypothetical protein